MHKIDIEKDIHVPPELLANRIMGFPFKSGSGHTVLNFLIQGVTLFLLSVVGGFMVGYFISTFCK